MRWIREHKILTTISIVIILLIVVIVGSYAIGGKNTIVGKTVDKVVTTIEKPFAKLANGLNNTFGFFNYKETKEENEKLKEENAKLKKENAELALSESEYEELKNFSKIFEYEPFTDKSSAVVGSLTAVDNSMIYRDFLIDVGTDKGIKEGNIVVDNDGLVGTIRTVTSSTATVYPITNAKTSISFVVKNRENVLGVLKGDGSDKLNGYVLDSSANVLEGDTLITSGRGTLPKGINLGKVTKVQYDSDTKLKKVVVAPSVKFQSMQKVIIFK